MGNEISGIAPSQIYPVETYFSDLHDTQYETSLGSTRFLKVAKCHTLEGPVVVKVFVTQDAAVPLARHKKMLDDVSQQLTGAANCLQFHHSILTDRAGFMYRQYVKSNMYDRISTRPFLAAIEKKWIAYQLLCSLEQCNMQGLCHGDIKLENMMVTSWTWLLLADFATFKPTLLPEDNPADFTYFFDTSRRRTCYIAPERFIRTVERNSKELILVDVRDKGAVLTPAMDIFSAGCAIVELFTEGCPPFDLTQLLAYRSGDYYPTKILDKIDDKEIRAVVERMIERDPEQRFNSTQCLEHGRGAAFPEHFYTFLWPFFKQFSVTPVMPSDEKIKQIKNSLDDILISLEAETIESLRSGKKIKVGKNNHCESMIIITSLITSCLRSLHFISAKLNVLQILQTVCEYLPDNEILDRVLPYMFHLLRDKEAQVRVFALKSVSYCLSLVSSIPRSDVNIFPEYILPNLNDLTQDTSPIVRQAYAEEIAVIAETAVRFLEYVHMQGMITSYSYETELATLHDVIQQKVATLFSDSCNEVKRTLVEKTATKLCIFFGKQRANDIILSHMITFLNDKRDRHLRISFFNCIVGVASFIGCQCCDILKPLLLQGVSDGEESVVVSAIEAMRTLTQLGLFPCHLQYELIAGTAPLLLHPNLWIRQAVVGFINVVAQVLPFVDVQTAVAFSVKPYLVKPRLQLDREVCLLSSLRSPIPRDVYDALIRCSDLSLVMSLLKESRQKRLSLPQVVSRMSQSEQHVRKLMVWLSGANLSDDVNDHLLLLSEYLNLVSYQKKVMQSATGSSPNREPGLVLLKDLKKAVSLHHYHLIPVNGVSDFVTFSSVQQGGVTSPSATMNEEWQAMFGSADDYLIASRLPNNKNVASNETGRSTPTNSAPKLQTKESENTSNIIKYGASCKVEFERNIIAKQDEHTICMLKRRAVETLAWETRVPPAGWRPKGILVTHLHEHQGCVNRLVTLGDTSLYASASSDGTVKVWDCNRIDRKFAINRSKATWNHQGGVITALSSCSTHQSLASASNNGSIHVIQLEKMTLSGSHQLNAEKDGFVVDMNYFDNGSQSVLTYATLYGSIIGWDLRAPGIAWRIENGPEKGVITCYAIEGTQSWMAVGTSSGYHVCWDLRFMLPISTVAHPRGAGVRRVNMHPTESSWIVSSVNGNNEISMWNMETQSRHVTLWGSPKPPLSSQVLNNTVCGLYVGKSDKGVFVLSGGTDARIRFWDLNNPESSAIICYAANDPFLNWPVTYSSRVIDGTEVVIESERKPRTVSAVGSEDMPKRGPDSPPSGHRDIITDIIVTNEPQRLVITAARDGTIKMWK